MKTDRADIGIGYVNPRHCAHSHVKFRKLERGTKLYAFCVVCSLQGEPVPIGRWNWLARNRAARKFYQLATRVDKENSENAHE